MTDIAAIARQQLTRLCDYKRRIVAQRGVGEELLPMLEFMRDGVSLGALVIGGERPEWRVKMPYAVAMSGADVVIHMTEGYAGPGDPAIQETIHAVVFDRTDYVGAGVVFRYEDDAVVFDDPIYGNVRQHGPGEGNVALAMHRGFAHQADQPSRPLAAIGIEVGWSVVTPVFVPPARNEPCGCGSGRKAKLCCWG